MAIVKCFTFNPFQENTYLVYDETNTCVIIDPGMYHKAEEEALQDFIENNYLKPVLLLNTHCHIDHIFGNRFVKDTYDIPFYAHELEMDNLTHAPQHARIFGVSMGASPEPDYFIEPKKDISFGNTTFKVLFTPGHSAGSVSFYNAESNFVIAGDALFMGSIGRTDLPGGDYDTLIESIKSELFTLPDNTIVYSGHGPETTIVREREENPFLV
jgi:glyoxylase-like metal-dependent hydrolase (beta-lactamase superfamily II)